MENGDKVFRDMTIREIYELCKVTGCSDCPIVRGCSTCFGIFTYPSIDFDYLFSEDDDDVC